MSGVYYLLPANLYYSKVQTIPVDIKLPLLQNQNAAQAATKVQNLYTYLFDGPTANTPIPTTFKTTVSEVMAPLSKGTVTTMVPAYLVNVSGWSTEAVATPTTAALTFDGGFPTSFMSTKSVDFSVLTNVLAQGTFTTFTEAAGVLTPEVNQIPPTTALTLTKDAWTVSMPATITLAADSYFEFDFSFYLYIQQ